MKSKLTHVVYPPSRTPKATMPSRLYVMTSFSLTRRVSPKLLSSPHTADDLNSSTAHPDHHKSSASRIKSRPPRPCRYWGRGKLCRVSSASVDDHRKPTGRAVWNAERTWPVNGNGSGVGRLISVPSTTVAFVIFRGRRQKCLRCKRCSLRCVAFSLSLFISSLHVRSPPWARNRTL
jgi:hypothetical protein